MKFMGITITRKILINKMFVFNMIKIIEFRICMNSLVLHIVE